MIAELTRRAAQNLELTLKSEIKVGPWLYEEGRLNRRSRKCNTIRGESIRMETGRRGKR